jgi:hypothetical protein
MRSHRIILATAFITVLAAAVHAQPSGSGLSPAQIADACAPPPIVAAPGPHPIHVLGPQDTVPRTVLAEHDLLVLDAGTAGGMQLGQEYFLRRSVTAASYPALPERRAIQTTGWVRIVAANDTTSIGSIEHACGAVFKGDYLEPFEAPKAVSDAEPMGEPDFSALSRMMFGDDERTIASPGDVMLIDHGSDQGVTAGERVAIYRDVQTTLKDYWAVTTAPLPLASIGEGIVLSTSATTAVVRVIKARDAVRAGDFAVPRKK